MLFSENFVEKCMYSVLLLHMIDKKMSTCLGESYPRNLVKIKLWLSEITELAGPTTEGPNQR